MNETGFTLRRLSIAMRKSTKRGPGADPPQLQKGDGKARATTGNKRLAEQIRKVLAKHYASKYRAR